MSRTLAIGDIHGGLKAVVQVLDFLIDLSTQQKCIFIKGNHDELLYDWLRNNHKNLNEKMWFKHGGKATSDAYLKVSDADKLKHISFLKSLQNYYIDEQYRLFIHAGFTHMNGVKLEYFPKLLCWDRTLWELAMCLDENIDKNAEHYPKRLKIYKEIFIGHTPVAKLKIVPPMFKNSIWNLDTGAAFKGVLTILDVNSKEYWQSDVLSELYPNEIGRI
jgi:serine/threonine protein phosphatase 1